MIPKKIHYIWLSGEEKNSEIKKCIATWEKVMPDYEIKEWTMDDVKAINSDYMREAIESKKWAFASDVIRLYAIYTEGGYYLDSDVIVQKRFDEFNKYDFVSSMEYHPKFLQKGELDKENHRLSDDIVVSGIGIQAAIFGGGQGNEFCKELLEWYKDKHFLVNGVPQIDVVAPATWANIAEEKWNFSFKNETQEISPNMVIFDSSVFAPNYLELVGNAYAVHLAKSSWREYTKREKIIRYIKTKAKISLGRLKKRAR